MCDCIDRLASLGYVEKNILSPTLDYYIYPTYMDKRQNLKVRKTPISINYCPACGKKIEVK